MLQGTFGVVGAMRDKLLAGEPCDVLILSTKLMEELAVQGKVDVASIAPLGAVPTGVALPLAVDAGLQAAQIADADGLRAALLASTGIYFPDPIKATAGIHFAKVLDALGISGQVASRLRTYPSGATAMSAMAADAKKESGLIGCTQVTEILYTEGVRLVGALPEAFRLETVYAAGVCSASSHKAEAAELVEWLSGEASALIRKQGGFVLQ